MIKLIGALLIVPGMLVRGWAIKMTWLWFIVPVTGLRPISVAAAYGLALFVTAATLCTADLRAADESYEDDKKKHYIVYPLATMVSLAVTVGIGWTVKAYFL